MWAVGAQLVPWANDHPASQGGSWESCPGCWMTTASALAFPLDSRGTFAVPLGRGNLDGTDELYVLKNVGMPSQGGGEIVTKLKSARFHGGASSVTLAQDGSAVPVFVYWDSGLKQLVALTYNG